MSRNLHKRQRKIQKQKAKRKAEKKELARQASSGRRGELAMAASGEVLHCCEFYNSMTPGMTNILLSRRIGGGNVAWVLFLVDSYCLGVKDTANNIEPEGSYNWNVYDKLNAQYERKNLTPATARCFVEGAVAYARSLGLPPASDYRKVEAIFGDIDPAESDREFAYGNRGKPCYVRGPYDGREKVARILAALDESCGRGNYEFVMIMSGSQPHEDWNFGIGHDESLGEDYDPDEA